MGTKKWVRNLMTKTDKKWHDCPVYVVVNNKNGEKYTVRRKSWINDKMGWEAFVPIDADVTFPRNAGRDTIYADDLELMMMFLGYEPPEDPPKVVPTKLSDAEKRKAKILAVLEANSSYCMDNEEERELLAIELAKALA